MTAAPRQVPLLGAAGRAGLRAFIDRRTLFAFDLDGTLAPIVADPSRAAVPETVRARLRRLDGLAPVVVVTGRRRADARARLRFRPRHVIGNHGAEGLPGRGGEERGYVRIAARWIEQLRRLLPAPAAVGVSVEDKGATISLHYRNAPDRARARRAILRATLQLTPPPRRVHGKYVENLVPRGAPDKGDALAELLRHFGCRQALYVGDDDTDEDVFRVGPPAVFGVRIGRKAGSAARGYLRTQAEVEALLDEIIALARSLPRRGRAPRCGCPPGGARGAQVATL